MSRLKELIDELCPNGVKYYRVDELCKISRGRVISKDYIRENAGKYPVYSSQTENDGNLGCIETYDYEGEFLTWTTDGANAGSVFYRNGCFSITNVCGLLQVCEESILTKYLYYALVIEAPKYVSRGMGNPKLMSNVMARVRIAVPSAEVQREIVRVLDTFTSLTAELTAELTARKKQYEFFRNKMLTFDTKVTWRRLDEITNLFRGEYITKNSTREGIVPVILGGQEPAYYIDKSNHDGEIIVVARSGASAGFVSYWNEPIYVTDGFGYEAKTELIITKYLYYILKNIECALNAMKRGAGVPHISGEALAKIMLPVPQIEEQERIVEILDHFDCLCNDLSCGLPAEIEARQKQYEYYRDKLLTFKELSE